MGYSRRPSFKEKHVNADHKRNDQAFRRSKTIMGRRLMLAMVYSYRSTQRRILPASWWIDANKPSEKYFNDYQFSDYYFNRTSTTTKAWTSKSLWCCKERGL
eukprot:6176644-Pleurochrysis_carterae.AAC.1